MLDSARGSHVVLLIGLACIVQTAAHMYDGYCYYDHPQCVCGKDPVKCVNLQEIPAFWIKDNMPYIISLVFLNGNITNISKFSLLPGLETIKLEGHPLTHISDDGFDLSATSLRKLSISRAQFDTLPRALSRLTSLQELYIEDTPIQHWDNATLQQISQSVTELILRNVNLSAWPDWISYFHLLSTLDLRHNSLKFIPDDAFNSQIHTLIHLYLQDTDLVHVPNAILNLAALQVLYLYENNFTYVYEMQRITASSFSQSLVDINLSSAEMIRLPNFSDFTTLFWADFSYNRISSVRGMRFPPTLMDLLLPYNNIRYVPRDFTALSSLEVLDLRGNQIRRIRPGALPSSLTTLDLSNNSLTAIKIFVFKHLNHLTDLNLDSNPITRIARSAFSDLVSLKRLKLQQTHLTEIPLAFTSLGPETRISMDTVQPISCPCPKNPAIAQWHASLRNRYVGAAWCRSGRRVNAYLAGQCTRQ